MVNTFCFAETLIDFWGIIQYSYTPVNECVSFVHLPSYTKYSLNKLEIKTNKLIFLNSGFGMKRQKI